MKIIYVAVYSDTSTNNSQADALENLGHTIGRYNYRVRAEMLGSREARDAELIECCKRDKPDLVLFSKCNGVDISVITECNKICKTGLWFMDAVIPNHWNDQLKQKIKHCTFSACDKLQGVDLGKEINPNVFHVAEGFDEKVNFPVNDVEQDINISFIGSLYGERQNIAEYVGAQIFTNAFGLEHNDVVNRSKININVCTGNCVSDRVFKILASKGFLITDSWYGYDQFFKDGKDLIIYKNKQDLFDKVNYFLYNDNERNKIRAQGYKTVQQYNRASWAKNILNCYNNAK